MLPIEHYWPPEILARVFPEKYSHLKTPPRHEPPRPLGEPQTEPRYSVERCGGCTILWLGGKPGDGRTRTNLPDRGVFGVYKKGQEAP